MAEGVEFPQPAENDSETVSTALETASVLWSSGNQAEAVRMLRRAAEAAGDAGDDLRAVTLARAAADFTTELNLPRSVPPPPAQEPGPESDELGERMTIPRIGDAPRPPPAPSRPPAAPSRPPAAPSRPPGASLRPRQALRVSVLPSDEDKGLLLVRVLGEGEPPPAGAHEAMLVALDVGAHLLSKKR